MLFTSRAAFAAPALTVIALLSIGASAAPSLDSTSQHSTLVKRVPTYSGCYSSSEGLTEGRTFLYQSTSYCQQSICTGQQSVMGLTNGNDCWCGNEVPPASSKVDDAKCNVGCTGFGDVKCGGNGFFSVYFTGNGQVDNVQDGSSSSSSPSPSATQPVQIVVTSVAPGQTVVVTQPANGSSSASHGGSAGGTNTAGIAAGVVVGIVVLAAIIGGVYFYLRRRRQLAIEEEHRQRSQVSDFIAGGERKPLGSLYSHGSDARLDPEANALRRNSAGSFMADDSQDYSRKILRVANPDSS